jgi:hypothetical protein
MPIPSIDNATIQSANLLALSLWRGIDLRNTTIIHPNDRQLFYTFGRKALLAIEDNTNAEFYEKDIRHLIRVGGLIPLHINSDINFLGLTSWFNEPETREAIANAKSNNGEVGATTTFGLLSSLADALTMPNGTRHITLASRILFFLLPNLQFFNLSSKLANVFGIHHLDNTRELWLELNELNMQHEKLLNTLQKPDDFYSTTLQFTYISDRGNWWHRRVIDLAAIST